jgi:putative heme iron utilization protein
MLSRLELLIDLLHTGTDAALATHSISIPGFPFASAVPFAVDELHRPVLLLSSLAEHSRNLAANPRASLMIAKPLGEGEVARVSLVGEIRPFAADELLVRRYLRYQPAAERFLQLGDFQFLRLEPKRILAVGGFARASWLEGDRLEMAPHVSLAQEIEVLEKLATESIGPMDLIGLDAYGVDLRRGAQRERLRFGAGPAAPEAVLPAALRELRARAVKVTAQ